MEFLFSFLDNLVFFQDCVISRRNNYYFSCFYLRALRVLVPHALFAVHSLVPKKPWILCALVQFSSRALHAAVQHVPHYLRVLVLHVPYVWSHLTCLTCSGVSPASYLMCSYVSYPRFSCVSRASLNSGSSCSTYSNASYALQFSCITSLLFLMFHLSELFSNLDYG